MPETGPVEHHHFVQAPIRPLDEDGVTVCKVGSGCFLVAAVVLGLRHDALVAAGHGWYLHVAITGVVLGLLGLVWCTRRRRRR